MCIVLTATGSVYLKRGVRNADAEASKIPYSFSPPEDCGVLFTLGGNSVFTQLDFSETRLRIIFGVGEKLTPEDYGYTVDYEIEGTLDIFALLADGAGGIELENGFETVRYTGVQAADLLARTDDSEKHREIVNALLKAIAENALSDNTYNKVIEQSNTELTVPDCHRWNAYISEMCENAKAIN